MKEKNKTFLHFSSRGDWQPCLMLLALPQLEYRKDPKAYFLITEDYEAYKEYMAEKAAQ